MALQSKTYTRSTETLFDILDGLKAAYAAAGMSEPQVHMQLDMTSGELCHVFNRGQMETVLLCASIPDLPVKAGSMGLPPPGIDLAVIDDWGFRPGLRTLNASPILASYCVCVYTLWLPAVSLTSG